MSVGMTCSTGRPENLLCTVLIIYKVFIWQNWKWCFGMQWKFIKVMHVSLIDYILKGKTLWCFGKHRGKVYDELLLTLNVRRPSYLGLTRSISWLLMPWLLTSLGHQQLWYWLYRICRSFSYLRKDFKYPYHINVEEWHKIEIYVFVPSEQFSM